MQGDLPIPRAISQNDNCAHAHCHTGSLAFEALIRGEEFADEFVNCGFLNFEVQHLLVSIGPVELEKLSVDPFGGLHSPRILGRHSPESWEGITIAIAIAIAITTATAIAIAITKTIAIAITIATAIAMAMYVRYIYSHIYIYAQP